MSGGVSQAQGATVRRGVVDRRTRSMVALAAILALLFVSLALLLQRAAGTAIDVAITLGIQRIDGPAFTQAMVAISALGYWPWSWLFFGGGVASLFFAGFRREALFVLATHGAVLLVAYIKLLVERPRPTADVVRVMSELGDFSYPSGHVTSYVTFYGFLFFLTYVLFRRSWRRTAALVLLALPVGLVGISRIHLGHHWASDVLGGYALGTAYLLILIEAYRLLIVKPATQPPPAAQPS
jgi:membrane-associated phospholipid phosphatase